MQRTLARELSLDTNAARSAMFKLNSKLTELTSAARQRQSLQAAILARLSEYKLADSIWTLVRPATIAQSPLRGEGLEESPLPWQVAIGLFRSGRDEDGRRLADELRHQSPSAAVTAELRAWMSPNASPTAVATQLSPRADTEPARVRAVYTFTRRYAAGEATRTMAFARALQNPAWRREAMQLAGTLLGRAGRSRELIEAADALDLEPPERTAIYRGLVAGIAQDPAFDSLEPAR